MPRGRRPESDVQEERHQARTRETGGVPNPAYPDRHSTTGTTPSGEFVGRAGGDDPGDVGESGAERRAEAAREREEAARGDDGREDGGENGDGR